MWHISLISFLAKKLCKTESDEAALFVKIFFNSLIENVYALNDGLEAVALIGITNDLLQALNAYSGQSISTNKFARLLVGLTILHYKHVSEERVTMATVTSAFQDSAILNMLGIPVLHTNNPFAYDANVITHLKIIEKDVFRWLKNHVKTDFSEFVNTLNYLLNQVNNQHEIITDLVQCLAALEGESDDLDLLIYSLRRHQSLFFTTLKSIPKADSPVHCKVDGETYVILLDETEEDKMILDTSKKINVKIKLWLDFEWTDLCENIAGLIEVSKKSIQSNDHSLLKCQSRKLVLDLTKLIEHIRHGQYDCVDSILLTLNDLQSIHMDSILEKTILRLESDYKSSRYFINPDNITTMTSISPIVN